MTDIRDLNDDGVTVDECDLEFDYQPALTKKLDGFDSSVDQHFINHVVLWKVNRYAEVDDHLLHLLNQIKRHGRKIDRDLTRETIKKLVSRRGFRLPMASAVLRFINPEAFQVIDQRVYRLLNGKPYSEPSNDDAKVDFYFRYLEQVRAACETHQIDYRVADRVLYKMDRRINSQVKIKY